MNRRLNALALLLALVFAAVTAGGCETVALSYQPTDGGTVVYERRTVLNDRQLEGLDAGLDEDGNPSVKLEAANTQARVDAIIRLLEAAR